MNKFLIPIILVLFLFPAFSSAVSLKLHDGTEISLDGLSDTEKANMIKYVEKMNKASGKTLGQSAADVILEGATDPVKLNQWRKLITGTIKDIANDLNVSVNEFVKTPVGLGVAALIFYKVAGKDMIGTIIDVVLVIPFWIVIMIVIGITSSRYLGHTIEYMEIMSSPQSLSNDDARNALADQIKGTKASEKIPIKIPIRVCRYKWNSNDARTTFGAFMVGIPIVCTVAAFLVVFI